MPTNKKEGAPLEIDVKSIAEDGTFSGYASVFNVKDSYGDIVAPGAFTASLAKRPAGRVKMLYMHNTRDVIGVWKSFEEDAHGLKATGQLILEVPSAKAAYALMKASAIDGLSIGFRTVRDRVDRTKSARILEEVDLLEVSIVSFPANDSATVSTVKHHHNTDFSILVAAINDTRRTIQKGTK